MGIKRYLSFKNWYSNNTVILLKREPHLCEKVTLKYNHKVALVTIENVTDTQCFENKYYTKIYREMLAHGDTGIFGYIDNICVARLWGEINPIGINECGVDLKLDEDSVFIHYVETAKNYRRQGIARECLGYLVEIYQDKIMYVTISSNNLASMYLHKYFGFKAIAILCEKRRMMKTIGFRYDLW